MVERYITHLPSHDGLPAAAFGWNEDNQSSFSCGVNMAQAWLDDLDSGWL